MKILSKEAFEEVSIDASILPIKEVVKKKLKQTEMDKIACDKYRRDREVKNDIKDFDIKIDAFVDKVNFKEKLAQDTHQREVAINFLKKANVYEDSEYIKGLKANAMKNKLKNFTKV